MSRAMATSILRKFSACRSSLEAKLILESLVTPSTRKATSWPNSRSMSVVVASVSSTTSWRSPAHTLAVSSLRLVMTPGHARRVGEVGVAALARLPLVRLLPVGIGPRDQVDVGARLVASNTIDELIQREHACFRANLRVLTVTPRSLRRKFVTVFSPIPEASRRHPGGIAGGVTEARREARAGRME